MSEYLVLCGKLSAHATPAKDVIALDVDAPQHAPNRVNLKIRDISTRMAQDVPPILADLLELAVYVYCADQFTSRGGDTMQELGRKWRRALRFQIPVRCPEVWTRSDVQDLLVETLGFLSDDDYLFEFARHPDPGPPGLQHHLDFAASADQGFVPDDIILFSGGLDSLVGAVDSLIGQGRKAALVSHQAAPMIISKQSRLVAALRWRNRRRRPARRGTAKPSPPTNVSAMQRRTTASNTWRRRSLSRKRPWRFLEKVEWSGTSPARPSRQKPTIGEVHMDLLA
jgi:hypothetical protein